MKARRFYEQAGLIALREGIHPRSGDPIIYYGWNAVQATAINNP
jgi:putative acetyltransferase